MIEFAAIVATISSETVPPETPMNTSAPAITSARLPRATGHVGSHLGERLLGVVQRPTRGVQHARAVHHAHVAHTGREQDPGDCNTRGTGARNDHAGGLHQPVGQAQRVLQRGERDHGRTVLVVVEDRDVEAALELLLDLEAAGRGDVLEVDATEARCDTNHGLDDLVDVLRRQADRDRVHAAELLEQHRLALHHGHRRGGADVAETEDRRAVGDHGDGVRDPGVVVGKARVLGNGLAHPRDTGGVGHRELSGPLSATREAISILPPTCSAKTGSSAREFSRSSICSDATTKGIPWGDEARRRDRHGLM